MKPIMIDMNEMSDSREVYESRPHPFFVGFIYLILGLLVFALLWAAFFKIDIVVKGTGTITPKGDSSTITNTKAGVVTACHIVDGQAVEKGDLLYEIENDDLELELSNYESQKLDNEQRIEMLEGYLEWLFDDSVDLKAYEENPYYTEYSARARLVEVNVNTARQEYANEQNSYQTKLDASGNVVGYYETEIEKLGQLRDAVKTRMNPFPAEDSYYYAKMNDYLTQYQGTMAQHQLTIDSINEKLDVAFGEIESAKNSEEKTAKEAVAKELQQQKEAAEAEMFTVLLNLETNTISSIEASILSAQQNLISSTGNQSEIQSALENISNTGTGDVIESVKQTEIKAVTAEISACKTKQTELDSAVKSLTQKMGETAVCAPISGVVNLTEPLVEENYLAAGANVMTIIPQNESGYQVEAYIENQDIAKIKEGMAVKYEIAAYPSSEYGTMEGTVEFVSADLKTQSETGSAYYMVETSIDDANLMNEAGEEAHLKTGMLCEVKVVVDEKSVLRYMLEKIKLVD